MTFLVAGCFNPQIADGGFQCNPSDPSPCPDGYFCRNLSGAFLCTRNESAPTGGGQDLAMSPGGGGGAGGGGVGGGGGGGDVDMAMPNGPEDMANAPPDLTTPPNNCTASSLVINEVQTGSGVSGGATDEFIEIFNPCSNSITLSGAKLVYRSDTASSDSTTLVATVSKTIAAQGYLLFTNTGYSGSPGDYTYTNGLADGGGGVGLRDSGGTLLCSMGWGTANNTFQNGSAAPTEAAGHSIARKPNGANTHNDSVDFKSSTPTPGAAN
ncbi:MAG TPA: lamin tail domain-containing protein [Polyangia bacterium]